MVVVQTTTIVRDLKGLNELVEWIDPTLPLFFDTETTGYDGSDLRADKPVALQFHQRDRTFIVDVRHTRNNALGKLLYPKLKETRLVAHNGKFDLEVKQIHFGLTLLEMWDTMIADQVLYGLGLEEGRRKGTSFGLKAAAERRGLKVEKDTRDTFKNMHLTPAWNEPFTEEQIAYMAQDVEVLPTIFNDQASKLTYNHVYESKGVSLRDCFDLEMAVLPALAHVEVSGVPVDWDSWMAIIEEKEQEAAALKDEVILAFGEAVLEKRAAEIDLQMEKIRAWELARDGYIQLIRDEYDQNAEFWKGLDDTQIEPWGTYKNRKMKKWREENPRPEKPKANGAEFNLNSPTQLLEAFKELGIPAEDTTDDTLEDLEEDFPIIHKLREYRKAAKFVQSFGKSLQVSVSSADGRLHPDYMQIGASSNRMSCRRPNFQQVPARSETGKRLRRCVKAAPGFKILTADFGSQELCIIADLSGDETMLRLFEEGKDLHSETARMMFGLDTSVNPKKFEIAPGVSARDAAKTINYGLAYGQSKYGLAFTLGIPVDRAQELIDAWYRPYQGVKQYFDGRKAAVLRGENFARTEHGWVRHLDPLPLEPVKPIGSWRSDQYREYREAKRAWDKTRRRLENQSMNTPIQGTGAGITKMALASFFNRVRSYNEIDVPVRIIAVVHDEIVVECPEEHAEDVARGLALCMDNAMRFFLKRVRFPASEVHIADCWSK